MGCHNQIRTTFSLNISFIDENESPSSATIPNNIVTENAPLHTAIGSLSTSDPDNNHAVCYLCTAGVKFALKNSSQLLTSSSLNYERLSLFVLAIQVSDSASPSL